MRHMTALAAAVLVANAQPVLGLGVAELARSIPIPIPITFLYRKEIEKKGVGEEEDPLAFPSGGFQWKRTLTGAWRG